MTKKLTQGQYLQVKLRDSRTKKEDWIDLPYLCTVIAEVVIENIESKTKK